MKLLVTLVISTALLTSYGSLMAEGVTEEDIFANTTKSLEKLSELTEEPVISIAQDELKFELEYSRAVISGEKAEDLYDMLKKSKVFGQYYGYTNVSTSSSSKPTVGIDMVIDDTPFTTTCVHSYSNGGYFGESFATTNINCTFEILEKIKTVLKF